MKPIYNKKKLTKYEIVVLGDGLEETAVGTPVKLNQWLCATNLVTLFVRKSISRYSEEVYTTILRTHGHYLSGWWR